MLLDRMTTRSNKGKHDKRGPKCRSAQKISQQSSVGGGTSEEERDASSVLPERGSTLGALLLDLDELDIQASGTLEAIILVMFLGEPKGKKPSEFAQAQ